MPQTDFGHRGAHFFHHVVALEGAPLVEGKAVGLCGALVVAGGGVANLYWISSVVIDRARARARQGG